jgi:hypothetical protein
MMNMTSLKQGHNNHSRVKSVNNFGKLGRRSGKARRIMFIEGRKQIMVFKRCLCYSRETPSGDNFISPFVRGIPIQILNQIDNVSDAT